jgi:hypothetical protein
MASKLAREYPDSLIVRVLRVTTNVYKADSIREIVTSVTPANVYTLWIREEDTMLMGDPSFGKLNPNDPVIYQVLDFSQDGDQTVFMLRNIFGELNSYDDDDDDDQNGADDFAEQESDESGGR